MQFTKIYINYLDVKIRVPCLSIKMIPYWCIKMYEHYFGIYLLDQVNEKIDFLNKSIAESRKEQFRCNVNYL